MLEVLGPGLATAVVAVLVFCALGLAVYKMIRDIREGRHSCPCGVCSACSGCSSCSCSCSHGNTAPRA